MTIIDCPPPTVTFSPTLTNVNIGGSANLTAVLNPSNAPNITFESAATSIATLSGSAPNFTVTGKAKGSTKILAKQSGTTFASMDVVVANTGSGQVVVQTTEGTFSPDPAPINTWVDATLSAQATRPPPKSGYTQGAPTWAWTLARAQYNVYSDQGPWNDGTVGGFTYTVVSAPSPPSDATYDYSAITVSAWFPTGGYWQTIFNAQVNYTDTATLTYQGVAQAVGKGTEVEVVSITVASGATQTNVTGANNWATVCQSKGTLAIVKATLKPDTDEAAKAVTWTGGNVVKDQPRQRSVDINPSVMTNVKATAGGSAKDLNIWAIWATITNQVSGDAPDPPFKQKLGVIYTPDKATATSAAGEMCAIATITPKGINAVVTKGWDMKREKMDHYFYDGVKHKKFYNDVWMDDTSIAMWKRTVPDGEDKMYDNDGPTVGKGNAKDSEEINFNARQYVTWNGAECSYKDAAAAKWYWQARLKKTETPQVVSATVATGNLDLTKYVKAEYAPP